MKKFISLLMVAVLSFSLLTGCSSPMKDYINDVEKLEISTMVEELVVLVNTLHEDAGVLEDFEPDMEETDKDVFMSSLPQNDLIAQCADIIEKIGTIKEAFNEAGADLKDEEVAELHEPLIEALDSYEEMANMINDVALVNNEVMSISYDTTNDALNFGVEFMANMFTLSSKYMTAFTENQDEYLGVFEELNSEAFGNMMDAGEIDEMFVEDLKTKLSEMKDQVMALEAENDSDETIQSLLLSIADGMVELLNTVVENKEMVAFTKKYDGLDKYVESISGDANVAIEDWQSGIE